MDEILISHCVGKPAFAEATARSRRSASREGGRSEPEAAFRLTRPSGAREVRVSSRYYSGVRFRRTTISCVATAFFLTLSGAPDAAGLTFPLQSQWTATLPVPPSFVPAYDADTAYLSLRNDQLVALSLKDGTTMWSVECPMSTAPAAGGGSIFVGREGLIESRSQSDGSVQWQRPIRGRITSLYWDTGWLLATTEQGTLMALRATDGEILWQRELGAPLHSVPAPAGDRLYLSLKDGRLVALALASGNDIWTRQLPQPGNAILALADRLYLGSLDDRFYCLDTKDGAVRWSWRAGADVIGGAVIDARRVYFVALDNVLRALDRKNGTMHWKRVLPMRPSTGPLFGGNTLIVSGVAAELHAYTPDGLPVGDFVLLGSRGEEMQLAAPPHLTPQDLLIILTKSGQIRALTSATPP